MGCWRLGASRPPEPRGAHSDLLGLRATLDVLERLREWWERRRPCDGLERSGRRLGERERERSRGPSCLDFSSGGRAVEVGDGAAVVRTKVSSFPSPCSRPLPWPGRTKTAAKSRSWFRFHPSLRRKAQGTGKPLLFMSTAQKNGPGVRARPRHAGRCPGGSPPHGWPARTQPPSTGPCLPPP